MSRRLARYRKVEPRMWHNPDFRELSINARYVWTYLLTNPYSTSLPGLFVAGIGAMADDTGLEPKAFREAFREVLQKALARYDERTRVVFVPNAIKHNLPENPNVVKSWAVHYAEFPSSPFVDNAMIAIYAELRDNKSLGKAYAEAFRKAFDNLPVTITEGLPIPCPNQEQEQEQDQDQTPYGRLEEVRGVVGENPGEVALSDSHRIEPGQQNPTEELKPTVLDLPDLTLQAEEILEKPVVSIPCRDGTCHIYESQVATYRQAYPAVDIKNQLLKMVAHWQSQPLNRRKSKGGCLRSVNTWLSREADRGGAPYGGAQRQQWPNKAEQLMARNMEAARQALEQLDEQDRLEELRNAAV